MTGPTGRSPASTTIRTAIRSSPRRWRPACSPATIKQKLFFARADADLSASNHLFGRFNLDHFTDTNPQDVVGGITLPSAGRSFRRDTESVQIGDTAVLGADAFNDARLIWQNGDPITQFDPRTPSTQYVRTGVSTEGESRYANLTNRQEQFADTVSLSLGSHLLKLGGDYIHSRSGGNGQEFGSPFVLGQFTFRPGISPSIPTSQLTINDVTRYTQGFGNVHYSVTDNLWSLFAQDDYRLRGNLILNLGVRYDRQDLTGDDDNVAPRLGFAWNPGNSPRTTVRGGFGIYYSQIQANTDAAWELAGPTGFCHLRRRARSVRLPDVAGAAAGFPGRGGAAGARHHRAAGARRFLQSVFRHLAAVRRLPRQLEQSAHRPGDARRRA